MLSAQCRKSKGLRAYNLNCDIETGGLLKVSGSYAYWRSGSISELVQNRAIVATDHLK